MDLNDLIKRATEFRDLHRTMANPAVVNMVSELIEALEEIRKPMPDTCMTRKDAEDWNERQMAFSVPITRRTLTELFDRIGHVKNTAEEKKD